jgi:hypothetical protein
MKDGMPKQVRHDEDTVNLNLASPIFLPFTKQNIQFNHYPL